MSLQAHRTALLPRKLLSLDTLTFLRAASTATLAGTYPYNIPTGFAPPPYPYGPSIHYRRRDSGLYGSSTIQHGNLVSEQNEHKSRRVWRPNVHNKKLWSNYLGRFVQVKVVTRVLRTIDKLGGLDEYLVGSDAPARIKELGVTGWALRWRVMQTKGYNERIAKERRALGLPEKGWVAEQESRRWYLRREGMRAAVAYLESLKHEVEAGSKAALEKEEDKDDEASMNLTKEREISDEGELETSRQETEVNQNSVESEFDIAEEGDGIETHHEPPQSATQSIDPAIPDYPLPPSSEELFAQLTSIAAQLRTPPDVLIKRARAMIDNRNTQLTNAADRRAELDSERAALASEIDTLLTSSDVEPILNFHATHLAIARSENALLREQHRKTPFTSKQIQLNVTKPPSNIPADKWAKLRARVKILKEDEPRRQQEAIEHRARKAKAKHLFKEQGEEIIARSETKGQNLSLFKKFGYEWRWIKKHGLRARFRSATQSVWTKSGALFRRKKPQPEV